MVLKVFQPFFVNLHCMYFTQFRLLHFSQKIIVLSENGLKNCINEIQVTGLRSKYYFGNSKL